MGQEGRKGRVGREEEVTLRLVRGAWVRAVVTDGTEPEPAPETDTGRWRAAMETPARWKGRYLSRHG